MRPDLNELQIFAAVARHRSFRKAAEERNVTASSLSHAMRALETRLGIRLLNRTTRSVVPTEAGAHLYARVSQLLSELDQALDEVNGFRDTLRGSLRLNVPRPAARLLLAPLLSGFLKANPGVKLELITDDGLLDIVANGFDAGVRFGANLAQDMVAVPLGGAQQFVVVAAPALLAAHARPATPAALRGLPCIGRKFPSGVLYAWEFARDGEALQLAVDGPLVLDDDEMMVAAAVDGVGFAYVYAAYAREAIRMGTLVPLFEDWCPPMPGFHLYYPSRRHMSAVLRGFIDWCMAA
ncbi:LysR family transcriptional regulator [Janthinobacterium fluminis]|uniref:LysR family transcriptional regulator n=1 Tax=Janthinobacterium fluminis TaxID=2987524 RepID=A0ABT5JZW2_9BURK|nr:LysR family transcriptional regulator [Janthinobacterium fluminis]MDC8758273.1 LysR family transcriptional regulator [Janthinobacterium fluminis]